MSIDPKDVYDKSDEVAAREIENEFMVVPLLPGSRGQSDALYLLNETGREIWEQMNGKTNLNRLIKLMSKRYYAASHDQVRNDVLALVEDLLNRNMIKKVEEKEA